MSLICRPICRPALSVNSGSAARNLCRLLRLWWGSAEYLFAVPTAYGKAAIPLILLLSLGSSAGEAQTPAFAGMETATPDRLADPGWWPTKASDARDSFAGQESCTRCHVEQSNTQPSTPMGMAAGRADKAKAPWTNAPLAFVSPPHAFSIASTAAASSAYSVTDGRQTLSRPLEWAFGSGAFGQTFLYEMEGSWYESHVSLYASLHGLDLTTGHKARPDESLADVLGERLAADDARHCFQCHTTYSTDNGRFEPRRAMGGLGCEACHGPGRAHVAEMTGGSDRVGTSAGRHGEVKLLKVDKLSPVDSVDFCGACHRTWADIAFSSHAKPGIEVVRFQPYRLEKSKCWGSNGDDRITCVACHDPHKPLERNTAEYDRQCMTCHSVKTTTQDTSRHLPGRACPVSAEQCTKCHMPKYNVVSMHGDFTDHWIRIVRPGEAFPE